MKKKIIRFIKKLILGSKIKKWKPAEEWEYDVHGVSDYERNSGRVITSYRRPRWFWATLFKAIWRLKQEYNVEHLWFPISIIMHSCDAVYMGNGRRSRFEAWVPTNQNWSRWTDLSERFYDWVLAEDEEEVAE